MNQLPIVILSKQLKYSLAQQKIKTLEKAIQLLPKLHQNDQNKKKNIIKLSNKFQSIKSNIQNQFNRIFPSPIKLNIKGQNIQSHFKITYKIKNTSTQFYDLLLSKSICQIYGPKGTGKTCLLLHFAEQFAFTNKNNINSTKIVILNCASGITPKRIQKLISYQQSGMSIDCLQIPSMEQMIRVLAKIKEQLELQKVLEKRIFIGIDMMISLLMQKQVMRLYVAKAFEILVDIVENHQAIVIFTNLVQHKYQLGNDQLYNHGSYNCLSTSQYISHKIYLQRPDKSSFGRFKLTNLKGNKMQAFFQIQLTGIKQLQQYSNS